MMAIIPNHDIRGIIIKGLLLKFSRHFWYFTTNHVDMLSEKRGADKSPWWQKPKVFNTLFLGKNKLKQLHKNKAMVRRI